jgi:hypothetical protein
MVEEVRIGNSSKKFRKSELFTLKLDVTTDIQNNSILLPYALHIDHDESDMKEDILSVYELPTHTTMSEHFKWFEERCLLGCYAVWLL